MPAIVRRSIGRAAIAVTLGAVAMAAPAGARSVTEFPLPATSDPRAIVAGPDRALWFTQFGVGKIGRITTGGAASEFLVPSGDPDTALPVGIAPGPDGALWLTMPASSIGRITTRGAITEFRLPAGSFSPQGIAAGPDGALWFTELGARRIGRITTDGAITEFPVPGGGSPGEIAAGPDRALWFTEGFPVAKIGRITTSGAITQFLLPTPGSRPDGIAAGPDGALWFTETATGKIGRITPGGSVSEFAVPVPSVGNVALRGAIAAGPDGALWFTAVECTGEGEDLVCPVGKVGRITTRGAISEFAVPTRGSFPTGIAAGPDEAMWFTEPFAGKIGRIDASAAPNLSLRVSPRTGCTSSAVRTKVNVSGGAKLAHVDLLLDGRRLVRSRHHSLKARVRVRGLRSGTHTLTLVAVDIKGGRAKVSRTFRRCRGGSSFTG